MSTASNQNTGAAASDLWIAAGVVFCLALGAGITFWLTGGNPQTGQTAALPMKEIRGELINSKPKTAPAQPKPVENPAAATATPAATAEGDHLQVNFDTLGSFFYEIPDGEEVSGSGKRPKDQIPQPIKELNNKKIAVKGFMVPVKLEKGATKAFLLVKDQSLCCFGRMPRMNEWISVRMEGAKTTKFVNDQPVTVFGKLQVGEEIQDGEVLSIYRMEAEDVAGPLDL